MLLYQNMSQDECRREATADYREFYDDCLYKIRNRNRRAFILAKKFPVVVQCTYKSSRNNRWQVILMARSKAEAKNPGCVFLLKYRTSHGSGFLYPKFIYNNEKEIHVFDFTPHLINRYKERFLKVKENDEICLDDFLVDMIVRNMPLYVSYDENEMYYTCFIRDGIFLSNQFNPDRYIQWKTFVSQEMLFSNQYEKFKNKLSIRERYMKYAAATGMYIRGTAQMGNDGLPLLFG